MADPKKAALAAAWAVSQIGSQEWNEYCQLMAEQAYGTRGQYASALAAGNALPLNKALEKAKVGDLVLFSADDTNNGFGHAGIYVGNGEMVSARPNGVRREKILDGGYNQTRFRGVADAPNEWQGRAATPELEKGAQQLIAQATGAKTVAENPQTQEYTRQRGELQARLAKNQALLPQVKAAERLIADYNADRKTPTDKWLAARKLSPEDLQKAKDLVSDGENIQKQIEKDETALREIGGKLATAQATTSKDETKPPTTVSTSANEPYIVRQDASGNLTYVPNPNYKPAQNATSPQTISTSTSEQYIVQRNPDGSVSNIPNPNYRPPESKAPQSPSISAPGGTNVPKLLVTYPDGRQDWIDNPNYTPPTPEPPGTLTSGRTVYPRDPATGLPIRDQGVTLPGDPKTFQHDGTVYPEDPTTGLPNVTAGIQLPTRPKPLTFQNPIETFKYEKTQRTAAAEQEKQRLIKLAADGVIPQAEAARQMGDYLSREVEGPLTAMYSAAQRQQQQDQMAMEAAQRQEDQRAETINRQRQQYGYEQGQEMRTKAAALTPHVRSAAFNDKFAQTLNAFGGNAPAPTWSAADFRPDPGQIPNMDALAQQEVDRALAHISPAAAARVGMPLPELPPLGDINQFLQPFRLPPQAPAA